MNELHKSTGDVERQMRNLRKQGLSLREIAKATGSSVSKVQRVVKDVPMAIGLYRWELRAALIEGAIINLETTGLDSDTDDIIAFGFLERNIMTVTLRIEAEPAEFYHTVSENLSGLAHPIYAWDTHFHESFLLTKLHTPVDLVDIFEPWREKARAKGLSYPTLDKLVSVPREYLGEEVVSEQGVRSLWKNYVKYRDKRSIIPIVRHCMEDLRQALYLLTFIEATEEASL